MSKKVQSSKKSRLKKLLIPLAVLVPLLMILVVICFTARREPLTPKEILAKQEWNEHELKDAISRTMQIQADRDSRREVTRHLNAQLKKLPQEKQSEVRVAAISDAMSRSLDQLRELPENERSKIIKRMDDQATRNLERVSKMSSKERKEFRERHASSEAKSVATEANRIVITKMTPEERRDFNPIIEKWLRTLREM